MRMNKKYIALLLALCLIVGLLPAVASTVSAEGEVLSEIIRVMGSSTDIRASTDGKCTYLKNETVTYKRSDSTTYEGTKWTVVASNTEIEPSDWNVKFAFPAGGVPTLTLKGAILDSFDDTTENSYGTAVAAITFKDSKPVYDLKIVIQQDSYIATGSYVFSSGDHIGNVTISSVGAAKLTTRSTKGICTKDSDLILDNANLDMEVYKYNGTDCFPLCTTGTGNIIINGGNLDLKSTKPSGLSGGWNGPVQSMIKTNGTGNITINGSNIKLYASYQSSTNAGAIQTTGADAVLTINGGTLDIRTGCVHGFLSKKPIALNGSNVTVVSSGNYALEKNTKIVMTGGSLTLSGSGGTGSGTLYNAANLDVSQYPCCVIKSGSIADGAAVKVETEVKEAKYVSVTPHVLTETSANPASCTVDGNIQYWSCATCGKYYADAAGTTEITDKESVKVSAACQPEADDGDCTTAVKCSICGKETTAAKTEHTPGTWNDGKTACTVCGKEMTCAHTGGTATCKELAKCTACGAEYGKLAAHTPAADDGDCTTAVKCSVCGAETTAAKTEHTPGTWKDGKTACTVCGKEMTCAHTGGTATCKELAKCTVCGAEYGKLAAHTPAADDGDCTTAVKCSACGEDVIPAGAHIGGTATCKAKAKCTSCGKEYGELAAHTPAADDGDCTTAVKCSVCGEDATAAKEHTGGTATCKELAKCANCGKEYGEKKAHTEEVIPGKDATTTQTGLTEGKKCSVCGEILVAQQTVPMLPSDNTSNGNPATGDNSFIVVWMGLMVVSALACASILVFNKKKAC